jgi:DNA repair photolyase
MVYTTLEVKHVLEKAQSDSPFHCDYTIFPYIGCEYKCVYCPTFPGKKVPRKTHSSEKIKVKINAPLVLKKEVKTAKRGAVCIHGYWPGEKEFRLTRKILEVMVQRNFPVHIITRSHMVLEDLDLLKKMSENELYVSIVMNTLNEDIMDMFEPHAPSPKKRIEVLGKLIESDIKSGLVLSPVIPYITDSDELLNEIILKAAAHRVSYVVPQILNLKDDFRSSVIQVVKRYHPKLLSKYKNLYEFGPLPDIRYSRDVMRRINRTLKDNNIPNTIPSFKPVEVKKQVAIENFLGS